MTIKPTVGRMVWYRPNERDVNAGGMFAHSGDDPQPFHAMVVFVHSDFAVNLVVYDHRGTQFARPSVHLAQDGGPARLQGEAYCEWMPYQKGQAAKAEALEQELKRQ
jgi:hypothetical protein